MNKELIKTSINYIKHNSLKTKEEIISYLSTINITPSEKNTVYLYFYPRPLLDMELISRLSKVRIGDGELFPVDNEVILLVEASRTQQYNRFMKHLAYSFTNANDLYMSKGNGEAKCCLCGKRLLEVSDDMLLSDKNLNLNKNVAWRSKNSSLNICLPCILQLKEAVDILLEIDPNYLFWKK